MCIDDAVDKIARKWVELVPSILRLGGVEVPNLRREKDYFEAIKIIDKYLRPSGLQAKSPAAFFLYEVAIYTVYSGTPLIRTLLIRAPQLSGRQT